MNQCVLFKSRQHACYRVSFELARPSIHFLFARVHIRYVVIYQHKFSSL